MDKNKIKSYAVWARRAMIEAVKDRAFKVGIEENKIHDIERLQGGFKIVGREEIFNIPSTHRDTLVKLINEKGYEQVIEEVAYTWFNRFMGLRFMEVNEYLPTGVRILSSEDEGKTEPDVLTKINDIEDELDLNLDYVYELQDRGTEQAREELYKYILIKQCNELGNIIPQMFEKIQDYTELLLPDNLLQEGSVIRKMVTDIDEEDWKEEVEIIGWMYQYYISEKHDEVVGINNGSIKKEDVPSATQLFTPKWIVKYMVDNSLGKLWIESNTKSNLSSDLEYYLDKNSNESENNCINKIDISKIKLLDNAMGSGHILVYAFEVFYKIYKEAGYSEREIPKNILVNNIYGIDIDGRATQLATFALIMKARQYNRRLFREIIKEKLELNIVEIHETNIFSNEDIEYFIGDDENLRPMIEGLIGNYLDAKEYGSIINLEKVNIDIIKERLNQISINEIDDLINMESKLKIKNILPQIIKQYEIMINKYDIVVTNPPYMGNYDNKLKKYINTNYNQYKKDIFSVFIKKNFDYSKDNAYLAFMTPMVWMYIKTFEKLREYILNNKNISSLIELEYSGYEEATVPICTFILKNSNNNDLGTYIKLSDFKGVKNQPLKVLEAIENPSSNYRYEFDKEDFKYIEGMPIAYWGTERIKEVFKESKSLNMIAEPKQGLATGDNDRFLKLWHEVDDNKFGRNINRDIFIQKGYKWAPCNKGGAFRRWYGNNFYVVDWFEDGKEIKKFKGSVIRNERYYFNEGLTWSTLTSALLSMRYSPKGNIFETKGSVLFPLNPDDIWYLLGMLNSKIITNLIKMISPTIDYHEGPLGKLPVKIEKNRIVEKLVNENVFISKSDWDSFENSWDFKVHPLLKLLDKKAQYKLESVFLIWETECEKSFKQLKYNEEELNRIFIDIYGLQDELTPEVEDKDITIRKADRERDIRSFISYAVGCMFGRYSIDTEGLIYAGGDFSDKWKVESDKWQVRKLEKDEEGNIISDSWVDVTFVPDVDNIIPITEDEYFEDDIVSRFIEFVKVVYGADTLEENLDFIAESLGVKVNETSRQTIRRYFLKEFYKDHLKVYQKRPIYWMFDSGKNDGFKALVYMHRYNESTVAKLRTDYLHSLQRKYEAEILRLQAVAESTTLSAREKTQAKKNIDKINKKIEECKLYDQVVAHVANERISIDLDDGVKHNYGLFQGIKVPTDSGKEVKMDLLAKI
ncbi:BREX-1 system adenine-specific DNA-methyltransferase PglX [uncultured Clostridium sp.]|uniref:BREX-1 system adenine-specific DNA-methyltransferase PglX n=1 Tax=uncultured Clostridium sp. TaxID=59620 RepID=UPI0026DADF14|nr:BREX-1 system adenine-specific DNA-methyltransferase PglX [uncultured Clostridium sp.]